MKSYLSGLRKGITSLVLFAMIAGPLAAIPNVASAATLTTSATFPSTSSNDASIGGNRSWSNTPTGVTATDGSFSQAQPLNNGNSISNYLRISGFDFSTIPNDATIDGIEVTVVKKKSSTATLTDYRVELYSPVTATSTNKAATATSWSSSLATSTYGGVSDLWGESWTVSDIKSANFRVLFAAQWISGSSGQPQVDSVSIKITYTTTVVPPSDTTPPAISEVTPVPTPGTDNTPDYTFTTNEAGTIIYGGSCSSGTTAAAIGNNTVTFNSLADGAYTNCTIAVEDAATNTSNTLSVPSFTIDATGPGVSLSTLTASPTSLSSVPVTVTFTEDVTGFDIADIIILNGTTTSFSVESPTVYTFNVTGMVDGPVSVNIPSGVAFDAVSNGNSSASIPLEFIYDSTAPTVTIDSPTMGEYVNTGDVTFDFTVTGASTVLCSFNGESFDVCTGSSSHEVTGLSDNEYTFTVKAIDAALNEFVVDPELSFTVDTTAPEVDTIAFAANPTNASTSPVTVTWNEDVTDFDASDITLSAGAVDAFSGSGTTYTFTIINPVEGDVTVDIGTSTAKDLAGNDNVLEASADVTFDFTAPTLDITDGPTDGSTVQPADAAFVFSTDGTGVTCSIDGGAFGACDTSTTHDMSGLGDGAHSFTVRATDSAGNETTSATISFTIDGTAPTLAEVTAVLPFPTDDTTPDYVFSTDEEGAVTVGGSCVAGAMTALVGNNTITFDASSGGTFSDCTVTVTDAVGNVSAPLAVTPFDVNRPSSGGGGGGSSNNNNSDDAGEVLGDSIDAVGTLFNNIFGGAKTPAAPQEGETALDDANSTTTPSALSDEEEPAGLGNQAANIWSSLGGAFQGWNLWIILLLLLIGGWFGYQKFLKKS